MMGLTQFVITWHWPIILGLCALAIYLCLRGFVAVGMECYTIQETMRLIDERGPIREWLTVDQIDSLGKWKLRVDVLGESDDNGLYPCKITR